MSITERADQIVSKFATQTDWEDKYKTLINFGKSLTPMSAEYKIEDNKVKGCQSQVWLFATLEKERIIFHADSDAAIAKGIVSLLIDVYSNSSPTEILTFSESFIDDIGLKQHLSMSRANGLASMLKQIKLYALAFQAKLNS